MQHDNVKRPFFQYEVFFVEYFFLYFLLPFYLSSKLLLMAILCNFETDVNFFMFILFVIPTVYHIFSNKFGGLRMHESVLILHSFIRLWILLHLFVYKLTLNPIIMLETSKLNTIWSSFSYDPQYKWDFWWHSASGRITHAYITRNSLVGYIATRYI